MIGFIALILRVSRQAEPVRDVEEVEEENASDDWVQYRVESEDWMPVRVEMQNGTN